MSQDSPAAPDPSGSDGENDKTMRAIRSSETFPSLKFARVLAELARDLDKVADRVAERHGQVRYGFAKFHSPFL
jgi:hypothetical protein